MENIELYELYHDLYLGCLVVCIVLAAIAVIIFFRLDIRSVIGYLSGRTAKRQIQKIEEESAATGRLYRKNRRIQQYEEEKQNGESGIPPSSMPGARKVDHAVQSAYSAEIARRRDEGTTVLTDTGTEDTSLLRDDTGQTVPDGTEDTSLLQDVTEQTIPDKTAAKAPDHQSDLSLRGDTEKITGKPFEEEEETLYGFPVRRKTAGAFKIEREIVMIHSKEII